MKSKAVSFAFGISVLLFLFTGISCGPKYQVKWEPYTEAKLSESLSAGKPAIIFFTAAWCGPCHVIKDHTFADLKVIEMLEPFTRLKADMSFQESPKVIALSEKYEVTGLPTILLFKPNGKPEGDMRLLGYLTTEEFTSEIQKFLLS